MLSIYHLLVTRVFTDLLEYSGYTHGALSLLECLRLLSVPALTLHAVTSQTPCCVLLCGVPISPRQSREKCPQSPAFFRKQHISSSSCPSETRTCYDAAMMLHLERNARFNEWCSFLRLHMFNSRSESAT